MSHAASGAFFSIICKVTSKCYSRLCATPAIPFCRPTYRSSSGARTNHRVKKNAVFRSFAADGTSIYIGLYDDKQIVSCPIAGCGSTTPAHVTDADGPTMVAVSGTRLVWGEYNTSTLMRCTLPGNPSRSDRLRGACARDQSQPPRQERDHGALDVIGATRHERLAHNRGRQR